MEIAVEIAQIWSIGHIGDTRLCVPLIYIQRSANYFPNNVEHANIKLTNQNGIQMDKIR